MSSQAPVSDSATRRNGRPPKQPGTVPTRDRLVAAAIEVFTEDGYSGASITDIAARAGISGPAVYKHFDTKADLLIQAARQSLEGVAGDTTAVADTPTETALRWLAPDFAPTRRLLLELHLAAARDEELLELLAAWHVERAAAWQGRHANDLGRIKTFYLLLLGLSQLDILSAIEADNAAIEGHVERMVTALFPERPAQPG